MALLVSVPLFGVTLGEARPSEDSLSTAGFDTAGLESVVLASFNAAGSKTLWSAVGSRFGSHGTLVEGEVVLDNDTSLVRVMVPNSNGSLLRLNDDGTSAGLVMRDFFGAGGEGADLTVWVKTAAGTARFAASGVRTAGKDYVNFNVPASERRHFDRHHQRRPVRSRPHQTHPRDDHDTHHHNHSPTHHHNHSPTHHNHSPTHHNHGAAHDHDGSGEHGPVVA